MATAATTVTITTVATADMPTITVHLTLMADMVATMQVLHRVLPILLHAVLVLLMSAIILPMYAVEADVQEATRTVEKSEQHVITTQRPVQQLQHIARHAIIRLLQQAVHAIHARILLLLAPTSVHHASVRRTAVTETAAAHAQTVAIQAISQAAHAAVRVAATSRVLRAVAQKAAAHAQAAVAEEATKN